MPSNPQVPVSWRLTRLGELASIRKDQVKPAPSDNRPYVALEHIVSEGSLNGYARAADSISNKTVFREGDTLYGKLRPNLRKVIRAEFDGVCSTDIIAVFNRPGTDSAFLSHLLRSDLLHRHAMRGVAGTKMPRTSWNHLSGFKLAVPPPAEQRAIAAVLDSIDEAIERTEEVIAATERLRDALLHDLLTRGLPGRHTEWREVPGLGTIPACWDVVRLGDVAIVQTGRAVNRSKDAGPLEVPYLSVANVKDGYLDLEHVKTMQVSPDALTRYGLRSDDVLFTEGGDADKLGRGTVWRGELAPCLHQNHVFAVRPRDQALLSEFLSACAESHRGKKYFLGAARQTTNLASMNSSQLKNMPLPLPTREEQEAVAMALACAANFLGQSRREIAHLNELKVGTAETLLAGCTSVNASRKGTPQ